MVHAMHFAHRAYYVLLDNRLLSAMYACFLGPFDGSQICISNLSQMTYVQLSISYVYLNVQLSPYTTSVQNEIHFALFPPSIMSQTSHLSSHPRWKPLGPLLIPFPSLFHIPTKSIDGSDKTSESDTLLHLPCPLNILHLVGSLLLP